LVAGRPQAVIYSVQQTVPGRMVCQCVDKGDLMYSLLYIPSVHEESLVGLNCSEGDDEGHLDA